MSEDEEITKWINQYLHYCLECHDWHKSIEDVKECVRGAFCEKMADIPQQWWRDRCEDMPDYEPYPSREDFVDPKHIWKKGDIVEINGQYHEITETSGPQRVKWNNNLD